MRWFLNITTRAKLLFGFGAMIGLLGIVVVIAYVAIADIRAAQGMLYRKDFLVVLDLMKMRNYENRLRAGQLTAMASASPAERERWLQDADNSGKEVAAIMPRLMSQGKSDPELMVRLEELKLILDPFEQTRTTQINPLILEGKIDEAKKLALGIQSERFSKMIQILQELVRAAEDEARASVAASEDKAQKALLMVVFVGLVALLLAASMVSVLNRLIAIPLKNLSATAERIATGDLSATVVPGERRDEIGVLIQNFSRMTESLQSMAAAAGKIAAGDLRTRVQPQSSKDVLGNAFVAMVENLRQLAGDIAEGVNVLNSSASEILASTTQLAASASESAAAVSQTTSTVEEVRQTAQMATQKAQSVSDSAQKAAQTSLSGRKSTESLRTGMSRISGQMEEIAASMLRLSEQGQAIGQIVATVEDLAVQSNLLAVNAAIEAAKAGEHGKGFGVVAREVKSLAEQSRMATNQVRSILQDIQKATGAAVMATEEGGKAVEAGTRQADLAGETIQSLANNVNEAAQAAMQITASTQQQLVGVDQVAGAMESIKQASTQNVASARQLEAAARDLNELGQRLRQMSQRYQI